MSFRPIVLILVSVTVFLWLGKVIGGTFEYEDVGSVSTDYPGFNPITKQTLDVSQNLISYGCIYFYRLNGRFPSSWSEVRDANLVQVDLRGFEGELIEPDVQSLDFRGDMYYECGADGQSATIHRLNNHNGMSIEHFPIEKAATFAEIGAEAERISGDAQLGLVLADRSTCETYALMGVIRRSIFTFKLVHGRYPSDWQEFITSGIGPINENSINPRTGNPFAGDGRPNDLVYSVDPSGDAVYFKHTDGQGKPPAVGMTY